MSHSVACVICRSRKLKCDKTKPQCLRCLRSQVQCEYSTRHISPTSTKDVDNSKHVCTQCKKGKRKCSGTFPSCDRCQKLGKSCSYTLLRPLTEIEALEKFYDTIDSEANKKVVEILCQRTIERNFPFVAGNFLDPRFLFKLAMGEVSLSLTKAVVGMSLDMVVPEQRLVEFKNHWYTRHLSETLLASGKMKLDEFQALLVNIVWGCSTSSQKYFFLIPILSRMAYGLILNRELDWIKDDFEKERRRRMVWNVFVLDRMFSAGVPEFMSCDLRLLTIQPPAYDLESMASQVSESPFHTHLPPYHHPFNLFSLAVHLSQLRYNTLNCVKVMEKQHMKWWQEQSPTEPITHDIELTIELLPDHLHYSIENVSKMNNNEEKIFFINLHLLLLQIRCDVHRPVLYHLLYNRTIPDSDEIPPSKIEAAHEECMNHALLVSKIAQQNKHLIADAYNTVSMAFSLLEASRLMMYNVSPNPYQTHTHHSETLKHYINSNIEIINGSRWADPQTVNIFIQDLQNASQNLGVRHSNSGKNILLLSELHPAHALTQAASPTEDITADMGSPALAELNWPFDFPRNQLLPLF
ncbi:hypothetical protein KL938_004407 [Ogataea parapolymorpha]|nr:hypothetical protein KL938_004407 [Ogataea parapolymorpha]